MFAKSRKEKFVEQAQDLAHDLSEAIAPHVERARDELAPRINGAREQLAPRLSEARDQIAPRFSEARDHITPRINEAREQLAPYLADAREQATPYVEDARERLSKGAAVALAAGTPVALEAQRRGSLAAAALKGEPVKRKGGKKKYFVIAGLAGLGVLAVKKLRGGNESANWQTSYAPSPAPAAPAPSPSAAAPTVGSHAADVPADSGPVGSSPGESLSDAVEEPHEVTTPDAPAEAVDVTSVEDPK